jgi:hypothetical protein
MPRDPPSPPEGLSGRTVGPVEANSTALHMCCDPVKELLMGRVSSKACCSVLFGRAVLPSRLCPLQCSGHLRAGRLNVPIRLSVRVGVRCIWFSETLGNAMKARLFGQAYA